MDFFIGWLFACFVVSFVGRDKEIGYWGAFFLSLILSPVIGLIFAAISKDKNRQNNPVEANVSAQSVASEIKQLKELLDSGAITQEEFEKQKNKLLN